MGLGEVGRHHFPGQPGKGGRCVTPTTGWRRGESGTGDSHWSVTCEMWGALTLTKLIRRFDDVWVLGVGPIRFLHSFVVLSFEIEYGV